MTTNDGTWMIRQAGPTAAYKSTFGNADAQPRQREVVYYFKEGILHNAPAGISNNLSAQN